MALEGNAKDFGLSEIFQLIAIQKKSGVLTITGEDTMAIFFRDGKLISTRDRRNKTRDPLKDYLLRYGFIGRDDMNRAQQIQAETNMVKGIVCSWGHGDRLQILDPFMSSPHKSFIYY